LAHATHPTSRLGNVTLEGPPNKDGFSGFTKLQPRPNVLYYHASLTTNMSLASIRFPLPYIDPPNAHFCAKY